MINDESCWFGAHLTAGKLALVDNRISECRFQISNELEYYYKEPERIRTRNIEGQHLSIALQGGGAKGIVYAGVFEGIKKFYG